MLKNAFNFVIIYLSEIITNIVFLKMYVWIFRSKNREMPYTFRKIRRKYKPTGCLSWISAHSNTDLIQYWVLFSKRTYDFLKKNSKVT